jgi:predicted ester cyclase
MSPDDHKRLIERLYADGINRQDAVAAAAFYAVDAKNHGHKVGRAGMQKVFEALFATFPDLNYRIVESTVESDRAVCKVMMTATHRGEPTLPKVFGRTGRGAALP